MVFGQGRAHDCNLGEESKVSLYRLGPNSEDKETFRLLKFTNPPHAPVCKGDHRVMGAPTGLGHRELAVVGGGLLASFWVTSHSPHRSAKAGRISFFGGFQIVRGGGGDSGLGAQPPTAGSNLRPPSGSDPPRGLSRSFSPPCGFASPCGLRICCGSCPSMWACPVGRKQKTRGRKCHFSLRFVV